mmetsp:Transcript_96162/g.254016  ORF Transcript_96162/g.254016 Transcript_96162/m.254016 type:complete len:304 (-) Transcript_96162:74-985(-)
MDLNVQMSAVGGMVNNLLNLRNKLLGMYGIPPDPKWSPGGFGGAVAAGGIRAPVAPGPKAAAKKVTAVSVAASGEILWKSKLYEASVKKVKRSLGKDDFIFSTQDVPSGGYICTVGSPSFLVREYSSEGPCASKKLAEHSAAKAALQAEFPEVFRELSMGIPAGKPLAPAPVQGQKRKAEGAAVGPAEGKGELGHLIAIMLSRPVTKEDIVYTTMESEVGGTKTYQSSVALPSYDASQMFRGVPAASKKDAENNAAKAAVTGLAAFAAPLLEEHKAKKARKHAEDVEKMKQKHAEKQAAIITA